MKDHPTPEADDGRYRQGLRILHRVAHRTWRRYGGCIELDELVSAGLPILTEAVRRYDARRGPFGPYLRQRMRWTLLGEVRKRVRQRLDPERGCPLGSAHTLSLGQVRLSCHDDGVAQRLDSVFEHRGKPCGLVALGGDLAESAVAADPDPERTMLRDAQARAIRDAVAKLPARAQILIARHYFRGEQLSEIAIDLEVSVSTVSRVHRHAMLALAEHLRAAGIIEEP